MKTLFIILMITVIAGLALYNVDRLKSLISPPQVRTHLANLPVTPTPGLIRSIFDKKWNGSIYRISWFIVKNPAAITLIPNFSEKYSSQTYKNDRGCSFMANGGFYTENYTPLGLFAVGGNIVGPVKKSSLINGFFSVSADGKGIISYDTPPDDSLFRLQSGPIVRLNGSKVSLRLKSDEEARRILVATDNTNSVLFGVLYDPAETFKGPLLVDVPELLDEFQGQMDFKLVNALNLDGGSASTFANNDVYLQELTSIGSIFCIK